MNANTRKMIQNLDIVGSIVMIVALFVGNFYGGAGYGYDVVWKGYKLIFNADYLMGTLFILLPAIVLITKYIASLKKYDALIKFVCPIIALILVFVIKGQIDGADGEGMTGSFGLGAWLYMIGGLISLAGGAASFFKIDIEAKANQAIKDVKDKTNKK